MARRKGKKRSYRRRSPKRKRGYRRRGSRKGRRPVQRGLIGRFGGFVMGAGPPIIATLATAEFVSGHYKHHGNIASTAKLGFMQWLNELGNGLVGAAPFDGAVKFVDKDGNTKSGALHPSLPKGSLLAVVATGLVMLGADALASKLAGGRPIKVPFTNYNATGGS